MISKPAPPPFFPNRDVCVNEYPADSDDGVEVFSEAIQVSVSARKFREREDAYAGMKSDLETEDWQFHSPPVTDCSNSDEALR